LTIQVEWRTLRLHFANSDIAAFRDVSMVINRK